MSDGAAMQGINAARPAAKHPEIYARLRDGELTLSGVSRLYPYLDFTNAATLLSRAAGMRQREIEELIAELASERNAARTDAVASPEDSDVQESFMFGHAIPSPVGVAATAVERPPSVKRPPSLNPEPASDDGSVMRRRDIVRLDGPGVLKVFFWTRPEFQEKLELVRRLIGRTDGRIESILTIVLDEYLKRGSRSRSWIKLGRRIRRIPKGVRSLVWRRDEGRCAFAAADGVRCEARTRLEYDHIRPWALGGVSHDPANIRLLCRAHNLRTARKTFGDRVPAPRPT